MDWNKFHPIFGPDLKVGFETTFPGATDLDKHPFLLYKKFGLIHDPLNESVKRIYEPAVKILGSCLDGEAAQVFFEPVSSFGSLFRRLVFTRKVDRSTWRPRLQMMAARHGEVIHFGFDSWNSKSQKYLSLAYPGINEFMPVYVKIQEKGGKGWFVNLEVWAWDEGEGKNVVVQARRISENEAPESLNISLTVLGGVR